MTLCFLFVCFHMLHGRGVRGRLRLRKIEKSIGGQKSRPKTSYTHWTNFTKESEIMSVSAFTKNVSLSFANMYCTMEGRIAFLKEAKRRELRKRQHLACAIAEEGRRRAITEEERRYAKRPRSEARVYMKKAHTEEKAYVIEHDKARAKMEKELAKVKKAEEALAKEHAKEHAKERTKERIDHYRESAKMRMRKKRADTTRILSLSDDDMMTAVLQSLGHPNTIGADLLSVYTLWLFTATKYHKNGRLMNQLALMNAFAVEYLSLARRGDNPHPYGGTAHASQTHTPFS